ncbi:MAG: metallophosphoesterase family protein [Pirellulaceae bacterium]
MQLAWTSDLHLGFVPPSSTGADGLESWLEGLAKQSFDALAISGDISEAPDLNEHLALLESYLRRPIYFVLGNHDFYRSSFEEVRAAVRDLTQRSQYLHCLDCLDFIELTAKTALVGHGCWADGLYGDFFRSEIILNDWKAIEELRKWKRGPWRLTCFNRCGSCATEAWNWEGSAADVDRESMARELKALGDQAAEHIRRVLPRALAARSHVVLLTHTPPFAPQSVATRVDWEYWAPHAGCKMAADAIEEIMADHPDRQLSILSGHVHASSWIQISRNIEQRTASAHYGNPQIADMIEIQA